MNKVHKRRAFFQKTLNLLPLAMVGGLVYPISAFIFSNNLEKKRFSIALDDIQQGIMKFPQYELFIYRKNDEISLYNAHCTHMGCLLNFDEKQKIFMCPCHKSQFDICGVKLSGPAQRNLDTISFTLKNKFLYVG